MSSSNCCFLTFIQISQEADQVVWYSHLFQNFPQLIVIHTVEGFGIVNKAEIDVFLELSCFFDDPGNAGNLVSGSSAFSKTSLNTESRGAPPPPQDPSPLRGTLGSSLRSPPWRRERLPTPVFWPGESKGLYTPWVLRVGHD